MRGNRLHKKLDRHVGQAAILALAPFSRRGLPEGAPGEVRRVLVVKLAALGDTILLVPALREIRRRWPAARVGMVGTAVNRALAEELDGFVDEFFCLEPGRAVRDPRYLAGFVGALRGGGWEVGIDFDQWTHVTPLLLRMAGVPVRVGFRTPAPLRHLLYTHVRARDPRRHEAENFLSLLEPLGITPPPPVLELPVRDSLLPGRRAALAEAGWNGRDPLVLVHPGCGHAHARAWPAERYRALLASLAAESGAFFVVTGAGDEAPLAEAVAAAAPGRAAALARMSIPEFVALVSLAGLVVSGNTGAMHVAAALGRPQVVLEGPNDPAKWGPINPMATVVRSTCPGCPCLDMGWEFHRTDGFCMEQIGVEEVREAVLRALPAAGSRLTQAIENNNFTDCAPPAGAPSRLRA